MGRSTPADIAARKRSAGKYDLELEDLKSKNPQEGHQPQEGATTDERKPKKKRHVLKDQHLLGNKGFKMVHETFPTHFNYEVSPGMEASSLNDLIGCYKEWAYELYPGLRFEDFVDRVEVIAKTGAVMT